MGLRSSLMGAKSETNMALQRQIHQMTICEKSINSGIRTGSTDKPFTDLVQIGIGGSHLGTKLLIEALEDFAVSHLKVHFISKMIIRCFYALTLHLYKFEQWKKENRR